MPELPEVETVVRGLSKLKNLTFLYADLRKDAWRKPVPMNILSKLTESKIIDVRRRAKWPGIVFQNGCLWLHLGMTGQLRLIDKKTAEECIGPHDHLDLHFSNDIILRFTDARRFGLVAWTDGADSEPPSSSPLGPEPLEAEWNPNLFFHTLQKIKKPIKTALMDASVIVGVGNIYASEALFRSKISPLRAAHSLSPNETEKLCNEIKSILLEGIAAGGSTLKDHRQANGEKGEFQNFHQVYGKFNQSCPTCGLPIKKLTQAGRTTFYCESCQH